jgi:hypothetical protein
MNKVIKLICLFLFFTCTIFAQTPQFQWVKGGGSSGTGWGNNPAMESAKWLGCDAKGNIYGMSSLFDFDIKIDTSLRANGWGYDDFVVFSYRCDGSLRWVRYFGSNFIDYTGGMTVDSNGNVFVSGFVATSYGGDAYFGDSIIPVNPNVNRGTFCAKLDSNGHTVFISFLDTPTGSAGCNILQMETDNVGNQCILIKFNISGNWGNNTTVSKGYYITKVDKNNGNVLILIKLDFNTTDDIAWKVIYLGVDDINNYYLNTQVGDTVFIGNQIATAYWNGSNHYANSVLAKFSISGNLIWYKELGGIYTQKTEKLLMGKPFFIHNKIYISGNTNNHVSIFGDTIINTYSDGFFDDRLPFIASFNCNNGDFIKLKHLYCTGYTNLGNCYFTISDKIYLANLSGGKTLLSQTDTIKPYSPLYGRAYPYIVAIDTNLNQFDWGVATRVSGDYTRIEALTVDRNCNLIVGGQTTDSIYDSFGSAYKCRGGSSDFFVAKISTSNNCNCTLSLPNPSLVSINNKIVTVKANATNPMDSLYWFWGDGSKTKYVNQNTNISHTYANGGNYTIILRSYNFCGTKDAMLPINGLGMIEENLIYLNIYPNPVNSIITLENPYQSDMFFKLYSITGILLFKETFKESSVSIDMSPYDKGIYIAEITLADGRKTVKKIIRD